MDVLTDKQRSYCMSRIRGKNTKAEVTLRKLLWAAGMRGYRINDKKVAGKPDIYFPIKKIAIFIDGCFWHRCPICFVKPQKNAEFWKNKIQSNVRRDMEVNTQLKKGNIRYHRFWEHEIKKDSAKCAKKIIKILKK